MATKKKAAAEPAAAETPAPEGAAQEAPAAVPAPEPRVDPVPDKPATLGIGRVVTIHFPADQPFDGEVSAAGSIVKVNDDGTINAKAFAPNGGADQTITGLRHESERTALAGDDPAVNLPSWTSHWS